VSQMLIRGPGNLGFRRPAKDGYVVAQRSRNRKRALLVDDVYTTGSRLNSAAFALRDAGVEVAGAFVVARRVNTDFDPRAQALWDCQSAKGFDWRTSPVIADVD
jgi:orotate phosphoribosyltransferase